MHSVRAFFLVAAVALTTAQQFTTDGISNNIETKPSVRLDPYIRKALLKALSELEQSEEQTTGTDIDSTTQIDSEILRTGEEVTQTSPPSKDGIQIHSFIVNGQAAFANSTNTTPALVDNKISIISTTAGNVENQITSTLPTQTPNSEIFLGKESGINVQQVRSISSSSSFNNNNGLYFTNTAPPKTTSTSSSTSTSTTTTTTTTTTPRPTHNSDGENIENVDKRDVQVYPAPLVAAFTVQQDAQGLPKKVIPIFQQSNVPIPKVPASDTTTPPNAINIPANFLLRQPVNTIPQNDFIRQQLALQKQLEEKQRILEEQLRLLQIQQRQQEELLRKQQYFLQQKEAQRQQQIFFEQQQQQKSQLLGQQRLPHNQAPNNLQQHQLQKNQFHSLNNVAQNSQVSIQQSVPLEQGINLAHQQQLPNREAVDFLLHLRNQRPEQFPLQENHIPQGIANFLQPAPAHNFNLFSNFNQHRPENQFGSKQTVRVFRQETGIGNFGVNNQNFNRFNSFHPVTPNRFFPNNRPHFNAADAELKQLLVKNGLNARSQEDLNIVSKVLALNHGVPLNNNLSNRLNFENQRHSRP